MNASLQGIVLTGIRYGERSRIIRIFTREEGLLSFVIHPERSKRKSSRAALYQPLTLVEIQARIDPNKDLHRIDEVRLAAASTTLHVDPIKCSQAMFIAELVAKCLQDSYVNPDLFDYLRHSILWLDDSDDTVTFHLGLMIGLCHFWGCYPQIEDGVKYDSGTTHGYFDLREGRFLAQRVLHPDMIEGAKAELLEQLCGMDLDDIAAQRIGREMRNSMVEVLLRYYSIQIAHFNGLYSHRVLQETFEGDEK